MYDDIVRKLFPSLHRLFQKKQTNYKKLENYINYIKFIINLNDYLKDDLCNTLNYIRLSLSSFKKRYLKQIADHIDDFVNDQNSQFFYNK